MPDWFATGNGTAVPIDQIPELAPDIWRSTVIGSGGGLCALFGCVLPDKSARVWTVLKFPSSGSLGLLTTRITGSYPALTPDLPAAHGFERELAEQCGLVPEGHPWLKPVRYPSSGRNKEPAVTDYFKVDGSEIHEVAVGPVHAGVIEPGHFRFQCHGERVLHLEIALGYQHRGVERALIGGPDKRTLPYMETLAGDTSVGHAISYAQAVESLAAFRAPPRAHAVRAIALELERLANHAGDLGALANDVGFLPTAAYCGRLRGDFLNMTAMLCGNRLGRGLVVPGGAGFDIDANFAGELLDRLNAAMRDLEGAVHLLWSTPSVQMRFDNTGTLSRETAESLGMVGLAARACGIEQDVRSDFPTGIFRFMQIYKSTWPSGDVFARAFVRGVETERSADFIRECLKNLPGGPIRKNLPVPRPNHCSVSLTEGWRGEICHVALTDAQGRFSRYKVVDPSFHNWMGLAMAMRNQQISDFPLCNKSFNLSYCGHDL